MTILIPIRLQSAANERLHWAAKASRVKSERAAVTLYLGGRPRPAFPVVITLTRIGPRMYDTDNNVASMKAVRDSVAAWLAINDNDTRVTWNYDQRHGGVRTYGVEITMVGG